LDKVINLSAFGDVLEKPKSDDMTFNFFKNSSQDKESPSDVEISGEMEGEKTSPVSLIAFKNLHYTSQIKFFHWQTKSYSEHKALDSLFSGLVELADELVESAMGKYGRPNSQVQMPITHLLNYKEGCLTEYLDSLILCYSEECKKGLNPKSDSDLINILDEMIALVNQTKYLITLK
jgi:hypothetical protein